MEEETALKKEQIVQEGQNDAFEEDMDEEQQLQSKKAKIQWIPLESNPDVLNSIIHNNGVDPNWSFTDVLGFDDESLSLIPKPVVAMIFLFPGTQNYFSFREKEEAHLKIHEQNISPNIMHIKQTISHACGMIALLHCLAHNSHLFTSTGSIFSKIVEETSGMSPLERGEYLETCQELAKIHDDAARHGQSRVPAPEDNVPNHFIAFVQVDGHLYELDGSFPINHGKCIDFVQESVKIMRQAIDRDPDETEYSAIAFAKTGNDN